MEPPKPEQSKEILKKAPHASPEDLEEYERLLALRYTKEPHPSPKGPAAPDPDEARLLELTRKLFGPA